MGINLKALEIGNSGNTVITGGGGVLGLAVGGSQKILMTPTETKYMGNVVTIGSINGSITMANLSSRAIVSSGSNNTVTGDFTIQGSTTANTLNVASIIINSRTYAPAWTYINSLTFSGVTSVILPNLTPWRMLRLTFCGITMGNTNNCFLQIKIASNATAPISSTTYDHRTYGANVSGNTMCNATYTANTSFRLLNRNQSNTSYATAMGNNATSGGFDGRFIVSPFNKAEKTKIWGNYVYGDHRGEMEFGSFDGGETTRSIMNSIWIAANTNSTGVPTFSGTIITEGFA